MNTAKPKRKERQRTNLPPAQTPELVADEKSTDKKITLLICAVLFLFGVYQAILFYGHQIVPNSDFSCFYDVGRTILSFKLPDTFKRGPVTGILQNALTPIMSGNYADLKASWLLNGILHPFNGILLFLIARQLVGRAGKWLALLCLINPWILYLMIEPLAETPLLFFILLTIYLIFQRSRWSYLFASIGTMVRYECAALILAAFVIDMIFAPSKKGRFQVLGLSFLASVPLILWMAATLKYEVSDTHYFNVFKTGATNAFSKLGNDKIGIVKHLGLIWSVGYNPLAANSMGSSENAAKMLMWASRIIAGISFVLGAGWAIYRRNWKVLVLGLFLIPYFLVHAYYPYPIPRFHMPIFWIALLISMYGVSQVWGLAAKRYPVAMAAVQVVIAILALLWFFSLVPILERCGQICAKAASMPFAAMLAMILLAAGSLVFNRFKGLIQEITLCSLLLVAIVAGQMNTAWLLNDGSRDAEFKYLADWYMEHCRQGEGLATSLSGVVNLYISPDKRHKIINYRGVKGDNIIDFARQLHKQGVVYIAWDSRLGLAPNDPYYELYNLKVIQPLVQTKDVGPYRYIKQLRNGNRFINIFKIENLDRYPALIRPTEPARPGEPAQ
ncbi:MAG: hypothetical protein JXB18_02170 [Sedimentisphaerales bacterium]|nr:hypothetical protein [Sedimentisphaerales bacterium]